MILLWLGWSCLWARASSLSLSVCVYECVCVCVGASLGVFSSACVEAVANPGEGVNPAMAPIRFGYRFWPAQTKK